MLPEDANTVFNRMLRAGYSTGAIKLNERDKVHLKDLLPVIQSTSPAVDHALEQAHRAR
jgi:hypothetical protein